MKLTEFRKILSDIPSENVITGQFTNHIDSCCVLGHYGRLTSLHSYSYDDDHINYEMVEKLRTLSLDFAMDKFNPDNSWEYNIAGVNNGDCEKYQQSTAKERSLAMLDDMIEAGFDIM